MEKKVTNVLLDRVKYFINAIENGEYEPKGYEFTINFSQTFGRNVTVSDKYLDPNKDR